MAYHIDEENSEIIFEVRGDKVILKYGKAPSGGGSGESVYLIKKGEATAPADDNTFSALRILEELLNNNEELKKILLHKDQSDRTDHSLEVGGELTVEGVIKALGGILIGENGSGITTLPDGKSQAVVDYLYVKVKAIFDALEVKKKTYVGGEQILSPAGMKCIKVEELADAYRCYFKAEEDGIEINNQFTVGTQAISQECNIKTGISHHAGNRYYWRLVTAVGTDYIDLSKTKCDPNVSNDIPTAGDDIVALGHDTDITRQSAIIMSSVNEISPSFIQYACIDSFSLTGKEVTVISPYGNKYIGDFILNTGINIATQLQILENLIKTEIQNVEYVLNSDDNYLLNASFVKDMEGWQRDSEVQILESEALLQANAEYLSLADKIADVTTYEGKLWLRLNNSYVKQLNGDITKPEKPGKFYVSLRYLCTGAGTLTCGFAGQSLYKTMSVATNRTPRIIEFSGEWDGDDDFLLQFSGDIYVNLVTLTNRPLEDFKQETASRFEQTSESIQAAVKSIDNINKTIKDSGWLTTNDGTKIWASCTFPDGTKAISLFNMTADGIFMDSSHINLKGIVTFESFAPDFQTAYNQAFGNASMIAKDDVAKQLGYNNFYQLAENAATNGKAILVGGYLNLDLIDVDTLIAGKVLTNKIVTSLNGKRIEIDPETSSIRFFDSANVEVGYINFCDEIAGDGSTWTFPEILLKQVATLNGSSEVQGQVKITPRSIKIIDTIEQGIEYTLEMDARIGILFKKNNILTKTYPAS